MSELNQACQTSDADLCKNALDHYNELADKENSWLSSVPRAIRFYFLERPALESEVAALRAELAQHKASLPTCEKHKPDRGARSGCVICSGHALSHAISRIDYACGEPNEMECSDYDVHYNEDEVVKRVVAFRAEVEGMREDAERYRWLRDHSPVGIGEMASVRGSHTVAEIDAAIDAASRLRCLTLTTSPRLTCKGV